MAERFHKEELEIGNVIIWDAENTEPVCLVYAKHHPKVPDIILDALRKIATGQLDIGRINPCTGFPSPNLAFGGTADRQKGSGTPCHVQAEVMAVR